MMESETPPQISPPNRADDPKVSSRRISLDQQLVRGTMKTRPEGDTSAVQGLGCAAPMETNNKGPGISDLQPETTLRSSKHIPLKGVRTPTAASRDKEAPTLMDILQHAPVSEEHRTLMSTVVERVLSAKSGLNEAFTGLLRGFEVHNVIIAIVL